MQGLKYVSLDSQMTVGKSPAEKMIGENEPRKLEGADATTYRAMVARMNYTGQDRADIANAVKKLSKDMSSSDTDSMARMQRRGRYLEGKTEVCYHIAIPGVSRYC